MDGYAAVSVAEPRARHVDDVVARAREDLVDLREARVGDAVVDVIHEECVAVVGQDKNRRVVGAICYTTYNIKALQLRSLRHSDAPCAVSRAPCAFGAAEHQLQTAVGRVACRVFRLELYACVRRERERRVVLSQGHSAVNGVEAHGVAFVPCRHEDDILGGIARERDRRRVGRRVADGQHKPPVVDCEGIGQVLIDNACIADRDRDVLRPRALDGQRAVEIRRALRKEIVALRLSRRDRDSEFRRALHTREVVDERRVVRRQRMDVKVDGAAADDNSRAIPDGQGARHLAVGRDDHDAATDRGRARDACRKDHAAAVDDG